MLALAQASSRPHSIVVPKVEREGDLQFVQLLLDAVAAMEGQASTIRLQALIETAIGGSAIDGLAGCTPRLNTVIIGYADLAASLSRRSTEFAAWRPIQDRVLVAARAAGLAAIDGPSLTIDSPAALIDQSAAARMLGFDGKWAIHPTQVPVITRAFSSTSSERENARATLEALRAGQAQGAGAVAARGVMLDETSRQAALHLLDRAEGSTPQDG